MFFQLGVIKAIAAEKDVCSPGGSGEAAQSDDQVVVHPLLFPSGDAFEHGTVSGVLRVTEDDNGEVVSALDVADGLFLFVYVGHEVGVRRPELGRAFFRW